MKDSAKTKALFPPNTTARANFSFFVSYDIINYLQISLLFLLANENNQSGGEEVRRVNWQKEPKEGKRRVMKGCIS